MQLTSERGRFPLPAVAVVVLIGAACSGGGQSSERLSSETAKSLSDQALTVAAQLEAGDCAAALSGAKALQVGTSQALESQPALRSQADAATARLVGGIQCPASTTTTTSIPPPPAAPDGDGDGDDVDKKKGHKGHKGSDEKDD